MKPLPLSLFAVALGLLTTLLLPVILVVWLHRWELRTVAKADAVRCDAGGVEPNISAQDVRIEAEPALEEYPLPRAFEAWWMKKKSELDNR